jgi:hypothetical protein
MNKDRLSKILDKINGRYRKVFEWLACKDLIREYNAADNPYRNNDNFVGGTGQIDGRDTKIVKNSQNLS